MTGVGQAEEAAICVEAELCMMALGILAALCPWLQLSLTHIRLPILCFSSLPRYVAPPSSMLLIPLPPWNSLCLQPSLQVGILPCLFFLPFHPPPACLTSGLDPVLTSRQYYSSRRYAEILEAPNYVWHHLLPFSGCPELYMRYVLEDVQ